VLHHGDRKDAPNSEAFDGDYGVTLCPFYIPPEPQTELYYCQELGEWWKSIMAKRKKDLGDVHHVGPSRTQQRIHRLISDADQNTEPDGYFNCTVMVSVVSCHAHGEFVS
jgi:hypothetical protein